jgi:serine/threonine protein kinase
MPAAATTDEFVDLIRKSQLIEPEKLDAIVAGFGDAAPAPRAFADSLVRRGLLTPFQAGLVLAGKWRGFQIAGGKYRLLQLLGVGGMGKVYLCEHVRMKRLVALKFLPAEHLRDQSALERFNREAVAAAALNHPNIVRAFDIDQDGDLHFLVMEYVDGASLHDIVSRQGPLDITRACHYTSQAALGLQHAHEAGWVHRDIKPGNLLLDRTGTVKILDMGLARFFRGPQGDGLTEKYDSNSVLGTADYLAPEQAVNSTEVDIRADMYSLGATLYFLLTGRAPFESGTVAEKLLAHQLREPDPVSQIRPEVPKSLEVVLRKMMAKKPVHRYQAPIAVVEALQPWTQVPIEPPSDEEMPRLCCALESYASTGAGPTSGFHHSTARMPRPQPGSTGHGLGNGHAGKFGPHRRPERRPLKVAGGVVLGLACVAASLATWSLIPALPSPELPTSKADRGVAFAVVTAARASEVDPGPQVETAPAPVPAASGSIFVSRRPKPDLAEQGPVVASISEALQQADAGKRIVVLDETVEGPAAFTDPDRHAGVALESGLPAGRLVRWQAGGAGRDVPLLTVANVRSVRVRGFDFNGQGRVNTLIRVDGACPGLAATDLKLSECQGVAFEFVHTPAELPAPARVERAHFVTVPGYDKAGRDRSRDLRPAAVSVSVESTGTGGRPSVVCRECRFEGLYRSVIAIDGPLRGQFERNRFYTLRYDQRPANQSAADVFSLAGGAARLLVQSNTAVSFSTFFRLDELPAAGAGARFELKNNLMAGGQAWVLAPRDAGEAVAQSLFAGCEGNVCRPGSCRGGFAIVNGTHLDFKYLQPADDERQFLRYAKSDPLARAGAGGAPAGYPPD